MCAENSLPFRLTNGYCENVEDLETEMSGSDGESNPNLRIHADCSNHLSYQRQVFAVACIVTKVITWYNANQLFPNRGDDNHIVSRL